MLFKSRTLFESELVSCNHSMQLSGSEEDINFVFSILEIFFKTKIAFLIRKAQLHLSLRKILKENLCGVLVLGFQNIFTRQTVFINPRLRVALSLARSDR